MRLLHPIPGARVSQLFGANPSWYTPYGLAGHEGVDFSVPVGTPVRAAHDGVVRSAQGPTYGIQAWVESPQATTLYAHLSGVLKHGAVRAGEVIALSGNTGRSTGPHLHWGLRLAGVRNAPYKDWLDPMGYVVEDEQKEEAVAQTSKIGLHFQQLPPWHKAVVNESQVQWVKMIDPSGAYPYSRPVNVIGRLWIGGDDVEMGYVRQGAAGADEYFSMLLPRYKAAPWVTVWEGPNEPAPWWHELPALNAFSTRWAQHMRAAGLKVAVGGFSAGQPDWNHMVQMRDALAIADYWHLHEYSQPTMQTDAGALCLRYRRFVQELRAAGVRVPPLLITETGIDGGAVTPERQGQAKPKKGWKTFATREQYQAQLAWYDAELCKDDYVVAAVPFVSGPVGEWADFDVDESLARWICARHTAPTPPPARPAPQPLPEHEPDGTPAFIAEKCRWWLEEEQRQREAGNTERANAIRLSLIKLQYRLEDKLKSA